MSEHRCAVCDAPCSMQCAKCKQVAYCSREHQVEDWKAAHRSECKRLCKEAQGLGAGKENEQGKNEQGKKAQAKAAPAKKTAQAKGLPPGLSRPAVTAWAKGLGLAARHEWFIDSYRMRVDDDYVYGFDNLHGLYAQAGTLVLLRDFLVYCKLAVANGVIPTGKGEWDWAQFLNQAKGLIVYAFEKSDAQEKYGCENFFQAMMGGRSLRFTGETVLGFGCADMGQASEGRSHFEKMERWVDEAVRTRKSVNAANKVFDDVGGGAAWADLLRQLNS